MWDRINSLWDRTQNAYFEFSLIKSIVCRHFEFFGERLTHMTASHVVLHFWPCNHNMSRAVALNLIKHSVLISILYIKNTNKAVSIVL